jgi:hypothetical protein
MAFDIGAVAGKVLEKIPWPVLVVMIALAGWAYYERSSKATAVAEVKTQGEAKVDAVVSTIADDKDKTAKINELQKDLCACRVAAARCEATLAAKPAPPKVIVRNVPVEPEPEVCK